GPAMIPLVRTEVVDFRGWLTAEAFLDAFAFGNSLPGPIVTKLAIYVGHSVAGWPGALAALSGATLPTLLIMALALRFVTKAKNSRWIQAGIAGSRPVVVALLLLVAWDFAPNALVVAGSGWLAWTPWAVMGLSLFVTLRTRVHPVF